MTDHPTRVLKRAPWLDAVLDRAERQPWIVPLAAISVGYGIGSLIQGAWYGWPLLAAGLVLTAVRPLGTGWQRRRRLRELRHEVNQLRARQRYPGALRDISGSGEP